MLGILIIMSMHHSFRRSRQMKYAWEALFDRNRCQTMIVKVFATESLNFFFVTLCGVIFSLSLCVVQAVWPIYFVIGKSRNLKIRQPTIHFFFIFSLKKKKISFVGSPLFFPFLGPVWYMCLKIENCCLKTFVEIRVDEKVR